MAIFECPVAWPTEEADLIPPALRPQHLCILPEGHVHWREDPGQLLMSTAEPHRCHCGATLAVRDAEPAL